MDDIIYRIKIEKLGFNREVIDTVSAHMTGQSVCCLGDNVEEHVASNAKLLFRELMERQNTMMYKNTWV